MWGPAIVMVRVVSLSITCTSPKLSEIDVWLLGNSNRNPCFRICHQIRDQKYGSTLRHSGLDFTWQKLGSWPSEWISGNSHQSIHSTGTARFVVVYIVCIVVCIATLKEKENTRTGKTSLSRRGPAIVGASYRSVPSVTISCPFLSVGDQDPRLTQCSMVPQECSLQTASDLFSHFCTVKLR